MNDLSQQHLVDTLARLNGFLPGAMDDNRLGRLAPEQAQRLQRVDVRDRALLGLVGLIAAALSGLYLTREVSRHGLAVIENEAGAYVALVLHSSM